MDDFPNEIMLYNHNNLTAQSIIFPILELEGKKKGCINVTGANMSVS